MMQGSVYMYLHRYLNICILDGGEDGGGKAAVAAVVGISYLLFCHHTLVAKVSVDLDLKRHM
jgi:hypothetical protein